MGPLAARFHSWESVSRRLAGSAAGGVKELCMGSPQWAAAVRRSRAQLHRPELPSRRSAALSAAQTHRQAARAVLAPQSKPGHSTARSAGRWSGPGRPPGSLQEGRVGREASGLEGGRALGARPAASSRSNGAPVSRCTHQPSPVRKAAKQALLELRAARSTQTSRPPCSTRSSPP